MTHRIIFMGTPDYAAQYLEGLIFSGYKPIAVITQPDRPAGRAQTVEATPVKRTAERNNIPVHQPEDIRDPQWTKKIQELKPDLIVVVAFGQIIPQSILTIPSKGCINVHPSLLPRHRGATPWQETILQGDATTGVTIMLMDEKMDHGPILSQEGVDVAPDETTKSLEDKTAAIGIPLLIGTLTRWFAGTVTPAEQHHDQATYTRLLKKESGRIDWSKCPVEIDRMIRALNPWPGAWTEWHGKRIKILKAHLDEQNDLIVDELQPEGKKSMDAKTFRNGYCQGAQKEQPLSSLFQSQADGSSKE
ncbi:methionyl-tRNA formyltransferase [Candidatus Uhrbacteria bacterium]|nr:methionyl-tRNA formyltransferase [Candidatus Uhrbacteria bacterium]